MQNKENKTDERYSVWVSREEMAQKKASDPTYPRQEVRSYAQAVSDFIYGYNVNKNGLWTIKFAFLFGSIFDSTAETVHDMDLCISLLPQNTYTTYSSASCREEMDSIQEKLTEICPMIRIHDWESVSKTCNDHQFMAPVRILNRCEEGIQPYVFSGDFQLIGGTQIPLSMHSPQIIYVDREMEYGNFARIEFLVTLMISPIASIYRGWYMLIEEGGSIKKMFRLERALGMDLLSIYPEDEFLNAIQANFEISESKLIAQLESCVKNRTDWRGDANVGPKENPFNSAFMKQFNFNS